MVKRLLIVEDDSDFSQLLTLAMTRKGFDVSVADSAEAATQMAQHKVFDFATVDLKLGGASGLTAVKSLINHCPNIRIVVLTAFAGINTAIEAIKLGAVHYLAKPADVDEIITAFGATEADDSIPVSERASGVGLLEWERIQLALADNQFNISATARQLGMHRRTLQRKLQKRPVKQ